MQAAAVEALKGGVDATSLSISKMEKAYIAAHDRLLLSLEKAEQRVDEIQPMAKWEGFIYAMLGSAVGALAMLLAQKFSH
jgi:predicted methyltransferase